MDIHFILLNNTFNSVIELLELLKNEVSKGNLNIKIGKMCMHS